MQRILNPDARKLANAILRSVPIEDRDSIGLANLITAVSEKHQDVHVSVDWTTWLSIICWWRGHHRWSMYGYEYHYDGSETHYYRCACCGACGYNLD